jgi:hypothetical protein
VTVATEVTAAAKQSDFLGCGSKQVCHAEFSVVIGACGQGALWWLSVFSHP